MTKRHRPVARESNSRPNCRFSRCDGVEREEDPNATVLEGLAELERLTIRAEQLTTGGSARSAINAWAEAALLAERMFGRSDAAVIDAMRIIASLMGRLEMQGDAIRILENAAERLVDAGWHRSDRGRAIAEEMRSMQRSQRTTVLADASVRSVHGDCSTSRSA